uniref:Uncharacterized protein n=1 Tax=Triticum urartu TaxID=4572 RepID=A0A8R7K3U0_TRIUA
MLGLWLPPVVLVVVHPDLEDLPPHAGLRAQLLHQGLVLFQHPPPHPLCQRQHLLPLLRREPRPEPLPPLRLPVPLPWSRRRGRSRVGLLAGRLGRRATAAGCALVVLVVGVVRERRRLWVTGRVGVVMLLRRWHEQRHARRRRRRRGAGRREEEAGVLLLLPVVPAVEAAMAPAGGAPEQVVGAGGHELPAAVHGVPALRRGVVAQALAVPRLAA